MVSLVRDWRFYFYIAYICIGVWLHFFTEPLHFIVYDGDIAVFYMAFVLSFSVVAAFSWLVGLFGVLATCFKERLGDFCKGYLHACMVFFLGKLVVLWLINM